MKLYIFPFSYLMLIASFLNCRGGDEGNPPATPQNFTAAASRQQVTLSWTHEDGMCYDLFYSRTAGISIEGINVMKIVNINPPYKHQDLRNSTTYYYRLTAVNLFGASEPTAEVSVRTLPPDGAPSTPQNFTAAASPRQVMLSWTREDGVSYNLFHSRTAGMGIEGTNVMKIVNITPPYKHKDLRDSTTYYYHLTANNSLGESVPTPEVPARTPDPSASPAPPETPQNFTARASSRKITLTWESQPDVDYYLFYSTRAGIDIERDTNIMGVFNATPPYDHTDLTNRTTYYYRLTAVNSAGTSEPTQELSATPAGLQQISAGYGQTCAVVGVGVLCWGQGDHGLLGHNRANPNQDRTTPTQVDGFTSRVTQISAGAEHNCALANGAAFCWGLGRDGRLGHNEIPDGEGEPGEASKPTPTQVYELTSGVTQISAGNFHTCAVVRGRAVCWGSDSTGELGNGLPLENVTIPTQVTNLTIGVTQISAGYGHACAVVNGAAKCWGNGKLGRLGHNEMDSEVMNSETATKYIPTQVYGLTIGVTQISAGFQHTCAVVDGSALCWGWGNSGRLGNGGTSDMTAPRQVTNLTTGVTQISAGSQHTCAVRNGAALCWGKGESGQLGNNRSGTGVFASTPTQVDGLTSGVTQISAGDKHTCAVVNDRALCWGLGRRGRLGHNEMADMNADKPSPTPVDSL